MAVNFPKSIDFQALQEQLKAQFTDLDPKDPSLWPLIPRVSLLIAVAAGVVALLWFVLVQDKKTELEVEVEKEVKLREDYTFKLAKAVNLDALKKQREQVQQYVSQLEKQLPSKAEMDALLSDINQAGMGRSLQFDLFRPGQLSVKDYYAELPIAIRVTGRYHDIGAFASDIAHLSRIVTLTNLNISAKPDGALILDTTARTYRYLDQKEIADQKNAKKEGAK